MVKDVVKDSTRLDTTRRTLASIYKYCIRIYNSSVVISEGIPYANKQSEKKYRSVDDDELYPKKQKS